MAGAELTGKLTIDASGFLGSLQRALDQGTQKISSWVRSSGKAKVDVDVDLDTSTAEKNLGGLGSKLSNLFSGDALKFAAGGLLTAGVGALAAGISAAFSEVIDKGAEFQAGVAELSAITGVAGPPLDNLAQKARNLAKEFGGSASENINAFKGILSKLGPDIANTPAALESMTRSVNTLSAATGDDATASMDALTTGLLQFQVPLDDAGAAAEVMASQMNVLAAGAKFGAAEVPQVAEAIRVAGVAASGAKVSFEETNAAIQALAAGGKEGAEAGTALRNVLGKLGEGRFLPKDVQEELKAAGVDINKLGDTSIGFTDRLRELQKVAGDAALTTKLFGTENAAAANILIRSVDAQDKLREQITGTNTAYEQAATRQQTFTAAFERFKASIADKAIAAFEAIVPALVVGLEALGTVIEFVADNWKAFLGPVIALIEPVRLMIDLVDSLVNSYGHQVEAQKEANTLELEGIEAKKQANTAEQNRQKTIQKLAGEFEKLATSTKRTAAEEKRLVEVSVQLNELTPGLVTSTKDYTSSLANVKGAAADAQLALRSLGAEMAALNEKQRKAVLEGARLDINTLGPALESALDDIDIDAQALFPKLDSENAQKQFRELFQKAVKGAASGTEAGFGSAIADLNLALTSAISARRDAGEDTDDVKAATAAMREYLASLQKYFDLRTANSKKGTEPVTPPPDTVTPPPVDTEEEEKKRKEAEEKRKKEAEEREKKHKALLKLIGKQSEKDRLSQIEDGIQQQLEAFDSKKEEDLARLKEEYSTFAEFEQLKTLLAAEALRERAELETKLRKEASDRDRKATADATKQEIEDLRNQQELITGETAKAIQQRFDLERQARARERTLITDPTELAVFDAATARKNAEAEAAIELQVRRESIAEFKTLAEQEREFALLEVDTRLAEELARTDLTEQQKTEIIRAAEEERQAIRAKFLNDTSLVHRALNVVRSALEESFTATVSDEEQKRRKETAASAENELQTLREKQAAGLLSLADYNKQAASIQREIDANTTKSITGFTEFTKKIGEQFTGFLSNIATKFGGTFDDSLDKFSRGEAKLGDVLLATAGTLGGVLSQAAAANENLLEATLKATGKLAFDFLMKMIPIWTAKALEVELTRTGIVGAPLAIAGWLALTATLQGILAGIRGTLGFNKGTDSVPGVYRGRDSVPASLTPGEAVVQRDMNKKHGWLVRAIRRDDPRLKAIERGLREPTGERWSVAMNGKVVDRINQAALMASTAMTAANATRAELSAVSRELETTNAALAHIMTNTGGTAKSTDSINKLLKSAPPPKRRPV